MRTRAARRDITVFGVNQSGGRSVSVDVDGMSALIMSSGPEQDARAEAIAEVVADAIRTNDVHSQQLELRQKEIDALRSTIERIATERDVAQNAILAATHGVRRFNGPVLCKPHDPGTWAGGVWLLDPAKQDGGLGLYFGSLAEVRRAHPELWVVGVQDGGVLLDAHKLETKR